MRLTNRPDHSYHSDPSVPDFDDDGPRTVMDARCGLCSRGAKWIARSDKKQEFRIIPAQSDLGAALFRHYGLDPLDPVSWLYIVDGQAFTSLDAIIRVGQRLKGFSSLLAVLRIIPRGTQDWMYGHVARNRYRMSRQTDLCALPDPDIQARLIK